MKQKEKILRILCYIILFVYFGFIPTAKMDSLFRIFVSCLLPIVLLVFVVFGGWGIVGLISSKMKESFASKHVFVVQIAITVFLLFIASSAISYLRYHQKFDDTIWQNPNSANFISDDITPRQKMIDDLANNVLPGKNKAEIEALLGEKANSGCFSSMDCDLKYILGPERGFVSIDYEWLLIWFDEEGNFQRYKLITD